MTTLLIILACAYGVVGGFFGLAWATAFQDSDMTRVAGCVFFAVFWPICVFWYMGRWIRDQVRNGKGLYD
jgi:hypothetical protein